MSNSEGGQSHPEPKEQKSSRRPDIDVIRIGLTWGILVYHTCLVYTPAMSYYVKILTGSIDGWMLIYNLFILSMNVWNMPMFFFLSGISAYFGLRKRTERQFREERIHRLLVPALTISLTASFLCSLGYFSKLSPNCQEFYEGKPISEKNDTIKWDFCGMFWEFTSEDSFGDHLRGMFRPVPSPHQGWFLCYLFVYSQLLTSLFITVHPNHQDDPNPRVNGFPTKKPISKGLQFLCCLNFFGFPTTTHEQFVRGVKFWLGHPLKLAFFPSIFIGIVEFALRPYFYDGDYWFFSVFIDICNDFKFIFILVLGYGITAADEHGMKEVIKRSRWYNFLGGTIILTMYSALPLIYYNEDSFWFIRLFFFSRGFAEWIFIIGVYGVMREIVTQSHSFIPVLSELAMPFYLTHQQVLVPLTAAVSWVPHLRMFPIVLVLATLLTLTVSWLITRSGPARYFFGLNTTNQSRIPGGTLGGFLPLTVMSILFGVATLLANVLNV